MCKCKRKQQCILENIFEHSFISVFFGILQFQSLAIVLYLVALYFQAQYYY